VKQEHALYTVCVLPNNSLKQAG